MSSTFDEDFDKVCRANIMHNDTPFWAQLFRHMHVGQLNSLFSGYLDQKVRELLSSTDVPMFEDIKSIGWDDTTDAGVYAVALEWEEKHKMEGHVFIWSTADPSLGGLAGSKLKHIREKTSIHG